MSQTRKKLRRLFQAPSTTEGQSFAARDLERPALEFDLDGQIVEPLAEPPAERARTATAPKVSTPPRKENPTDAQRENGRRGDQRPTKFGQHEAVRRGDRHPITSKNDGDNLFKNSGIQTPDAVRKANSAAKQTAPWAAANAFESWTKTRGGLQDSAQIDSQNAVIVKPPNRDVPPTEAQTQRDVQANVKQPVRPALPTARAQQPAPPNSSRTRSVVDSQRHAVVQGRQGTQATGPQASRDFAQWREQRELRPRDNEGATATSEHSQVEPSVVEPAKSERATPADDSPVERIARNPDTVTDRVQRRALKSAQAVTPGSPSPPTRRKLTLKAEKAEKAVDPAVALQATEPAPLVQASLQLPPAPRAESAAHQRRTASERLMWLIANSEQRTSEEMVTLLRELEGAPLRTAHQARRLRLLASALLELDRRDEALATLHALYALLPHDSWVSLTLAETYARDVGTWEEALHWCEQTLRLHPWLSKAQTLRDHLRERLSRLN